MDSGVHDVKKANWYRIIEECHSRPEGMNAKQWLRENGIAEKAYYYWQRKYRNEILGQTRLPLMEPKQEISFAEISVPQRTRAVSPVGYFETNNPAAVIKSKGMVIEISNDISDKLLNKLLEGITDA